MNNRILSNLLRARKICKTFGTPHKNRFITYSLLKRTRHFSDINPNKLPNEKLTNENENDLVLEQTSKHKIFHDKDSKVILDVEEEQERILLGDLRIEEEKHDPYSGLNLNRGKQGVYDIEDLISVLQKDNAKDIFVISVPKEYMYVNYIVIVTGKSQKHMSALAAYIRKIFKLKMHKKDIIPKIEGAKCKDWIALDLGNIALHIFSDAARKQYDLETLWTVGSQYDGQTNKPMVADIMEQYKSFLDVFQPENS
ncbi:uncharacterized protein LOC118451127 isoform X1 [Vespa mandarinia]|uniref:uncharacterized protein LOC118451127 isoform X1 n=1 Tax=Vespa mandarinia TaxID=7446 RepID=UPI00161477CE|nr:uncharacterized protein LOC118451127 isoform X1 [Vespa mandarinia]